MPSWTSGLAGAVIPVLLAALLARGGAESRLLRRARQQIELAEKVRSRRVRVALHAAAERDVEAALKLRESSSDLVKTTAALTISVIGTFAIPLYVSRAPAAGAGWQSVFWSVLWLVYIAMTLVLGVMVIALYVRRSRGLRARADAEGR